MFKRVFAVFGGALGHVSALLLAFNPLITPLVATRAQAQTATQKITVDPTAPRALQPGVGTSSGGKPVLDIVTPNAGVSHNRLQDLIAPNGLIFNNSSTAGASITGGAVKANPNLSGGKAANVILNEVRGGQGTLLGGSSEVFGARADLIIANENGVQCVGCAFVNVGRATLTSGAPTVDAAGNIALTVKRGLVGVWGAGLSGAAEAELIGREVVIDGKVEAADRITASGGTQFYDHKTRTARTAPASSTPRQGPYAVDATALGAMKSGDIRIIGNESGLGVRLDGKIVSGGNVSVRAQGDASAKNVEAKGRVAIEATGAIRQPDGTLKGDAGIAIAGRSFEQAPGARLASQGAITIAVADYVNLSGEVESQALTVSADKSIYSFGKVVAADRLAFVAGEAVANERGEQKRSYIDAWVSQNIGWMNYYVAVNPTNWYSTYFRTLVSRADLGAGTVRAAANSAVIAGLDVELTAKAGSLTNTGAVTAARNAVLIAGTDIINRGGTITAGGNLSASAGRDILNQAVVNRQTWSVAGGTTRTTGPTQSYCYWYCFNYRQTQDLTTVTYYDVYTPVGGTMTVTSGDASLYAGNTLTLNGGTVSAGRTANLSAARGINLTGSTSRDTTSVRRYGYSWYDYQYPQWYGPTWYTDGYSYSWTDNWSTTTSDKSLQAAVSGGTGVSLYSASGGIDARGTLTSAAGHVYVDGYGRVYNEAAIRAGSNATLYSRGAHVDNRGGIAAGGYAYLLAQSSVYNAGGISAGSWLQQRSLTSSVDNRAALSAGDYASLYSDRWVVDNYAPINAGGYIQLYGGNWVRNNAGGALTTSSWAQLYSASNWAEHRGTMTAKGSASIYGMGWTAANYGTLNANDYVYVRGVRGVHNQGALNAGTWAQLYADAGNANNYAAITGGASASIYAMGGAIHNYAALTGRGDYAYLRGYYGIHNEGALTAGTWAQAYSDAGGVTNYGAITGGASASIYAMGGGAANYAALTGRSDYAYLRGVGGIYNQGTLTAGTWAQAYADRGNVDNRAAITGGASASIYAMGGAVYNYAALTGRGDYAYLRGYSGIHNQGALTAGTWAQAYSDAGGVTNYGAITGGASASIYAMGGGVANYAALTGRGDYAYLRGVGGIYNQGTLTAGTWAQAYADRGNVDNRAAITGGASASIYAMGGAVYNYAALTGRGDYAYLRGYYGIHNQGVVTAGTWAQAYSDAASVGNHAAITAGGGVSLYGMGGVVDNYGALTSRGDSVYLYAGNWVRNNAAATITAATWAQLYSAGSWTQNLATLRAQGPVTLYGYSDVYNHAALSSAQSVAVTSATGTLRNYASISAGTDLALSINASAGNTFGALRAGRDFSLSSRGNLTFSGADVAWGRNLSVASTGGALDFNLRLHNVPGAVSLYAYTDLINRNEIYAAGDVSLYSEYGSVTNSHWIYTGNRSNTSLRAWNNIDSYYVDGRNLSVVAVNGAIRNRYQMNAHGGGLYLYAGGGVTSHFDGYAYAGQLYGRDYVSIDAGRDVVSTASNVTSYGNVWINSRAGAVRHIGALTGTTTTTASGGQAYGTQWWATTTDQVGRQAQVTGVNVTLAASGDIELKGAKLEASNGLSLAAARIVGSDIALAKTESRTDRVWREESYWNCWDWCDYGSYWTYSDTASNRTIEAKRLANDLSAPWIAINGRSNVNLGGIGTLTTPNTLSATSAGELTLAGGQVRASGYSFGNTPHVILNTDFALHGGAATDLTLGVANSLTNQGTITGRNVHLYSQNGVLANTGTVRAYGNAVLQSDGASTPTGLGAQLLAALTGYTSIAGNGRVVASGDIDVIGRYNVQTGSLQAGRTIDVLSRSGSIDVRGALMGTSVTADSYNNLTVRGVLADTIALTARTGAFTASGWTAADGADWQTGKSTFASRISGELGSAWITQQEVMSNAGAVVFARDQLTIGAANGIAVIDGATLASKSDLSLSTAGDIVIRSYARAPGTTTTRLSDLGSSGLLGGLFGNLLQRLFQSAVATGDTSVAEFKRSAIIADGNLTLNAGRNFINEGGTITAKGNLLIGAGGNITNEGIATYFRIGAEHECKGGACGRWAQDWTSAEMLSGSGIILSAGGGVYNRGSNIGAAGSIMINAGGEIVNETLESVFAHVDYHNRYTTGRWWNRKVVVEREYAETPIIRQGVIQTEFGDISLRSGTGHDIKSFGSLISAGGSIDIDAGRNLLMEAISVELKFESYVSKTSKLFGFIPIAGGWANTDYNRFATVLSGLEGYDVRLNASNNINALGATAMALNDLTVIAGQSITFDAKQNWLYKNESGGSWGFFISGFKIVQAALNGGLKEAFKEYINSNPTLAAVHQLATAKDGWGTLNGSLALLWGGASTLAAANDEFKKLGGQVSIGRSLANQFLPKDVKDWENLSKCTSASGNALYNCAAAVGIGFRFDVWKSKQQWTESHISIIGAGNDLLLSAGLDIALVGGTNVTAGRDLTIVAGRDLIVAAVADNFRSSSFRWGMSVSLGMNGITVGGNAAGSEASSTTFRNANLTAGDTISIVAGRDAAFLGAQVQGKKVYIDVAQDLIIASKQNLSSSSSWGFSASVTFVPGAGITGFSASGNFSSASRKYTDSITSITAEELLDINVGRTTSLMGAVLHSKGRLKLDTGNFIFDNYADHDRSYAINAGVSWSQGPSHNWNGNVGGSYKNVTGITHATIAAGTAAELTVRNRPTLDLTGLNRDITNVQRITGSTYFALQIPGLNLAKLAADLQSAANFVNAATAEIPDKVRNAGDAAVQVYQRLLANGLSQDQVRALMGTHEFEVAVARARFVEELRNSPKGITAGDLQLLALSEVALYGQIDGDLAARLKVECGLFATNCEIIVGELKKRIGQNGLKEILATETNKLINLSGSTVGKEAQEQQLMRALLACSISEPEVFQSFMNGLNDQGRGFLRDLATKHLRNATIFEQALAQVDATIRPGMTDKEKEEARNKRNQWLADNFTNQLELGRLGFDLVTSAAVIKTTDAMNKWAERIPPGPERDKFIAEATAAVNKAWQQFKDAPLETIKAMAGGLIEGIKEDIKDFFRKGGAALWQKVFGTYDFENGLASAEFAAALALLVSPMGKFKYLDNLVPDSCSFSGDTLVLMGDGSLKEIARLRTGDVVASRNELTGEQGTNAVRAVWANEHTDKVLIAVEDGTGAGDTITTTVEHPFHVDGLGFIRADELKAGMTVTRWQPSASPVLLVGTRSADTTGHLLVKAVSITRSGVDPWPAYNITVAKDHTYFVGKLNAWVHNDCWKVARHKDQPKPRPDNHESHHGVMSRWMAEHFPDYDPNLAPTILMPYEAHRTTKIVFEAWKKEIITATGGFDWASISRSQIEALSDRMLREANVPASIQRQYAAQYQAMMAKLK